jgi:hypothetical protein
MIRSRHDCGKHKTSNQGQGLIIEHEGRIKLCIDSTSGIGQDRWISPIKRSTNVV